MPGWSLRVAALRAFVIACLLAMAAGTVAGQSGVTFLYNLSSFAGPLRYDGAKVNVDLESNEVLVLYQNLIRIYNPSGMETFRFGEDLDLGQILDAVIDPNGDIILLSYKDARTILTRCNFRGVPIAPIEITNLPDGLVFGANRMVLRNSLLYFASLATSSVIVTDTAGVFRELIEFFPQVMADEQTTVGAQSVGFTVDQEGSIFMTMPALFRVYKGAPDGQVTSFGGPGAGTGKFGIVAGIASDNHGNLFVADKLKCVVMVFDKDFHFLTEFGYRGSRPENLIVPTDVAVDGRGRVFVSQFRKRGVSVFDVSTR